LQETVAAPEVKEDRILTGLVGRNIGASRSPWLHEQEAGAQGVRLVYTLFDFASMGKDESFLPVQLDAAERRGFAGLNVTYPYKQAVIPLLDELSAGAARVGAVNAIRFAAGRRIGHNTDVIGFAESMRVGLPAADLRRVLQFGAGGAGAATAVALLDLGVETLVIHDTSVDRRDVLTGKLCADFGEQRAVPAGEIREEAQRASGVVNATPVGMVDVPGLPFDAALLHADQWVADIVYFPLETELLRIAAARGCRTLNGGGMVVHQAAAAFEIFTGLTADTARMMRSFMEYSRRPGARAAGD
jgi:shikimate dehydrogenase